jgi:hypothetical protein
MDFEIAKKIVNDETLDDENLSVLLLKAQKLAVNQYFWKVDDIPTDEQKQAFLDKYEFEIYELVKALNADDARGGLVSHTELGITRQWGETGEVSIQKALAKIPRKAYVI